MNQFRRLLVVNVITLLVLVGGGFLGYYYYNQAQNYLKTDNAKIDGKAIPIAAPAAGKLVEWTAAAGKAYNAGDKVGAVSVSSGTAVQQVDVTVPAASTVVQSSATENTFVGAGSPLAYAYDMNSLYVTANVKETDIDDVKKGQDVDVYVDAYPNTTLKGKVEQVGMTTANTFSLLPSGSATANYTKVTQVVPVKITLDHTKSVNIVPGMNVSVRIHK
ncbi:HlyD family secretion protein [Ectobacillus ponti]|uniref:HlyD family efflux transporter periplasmic adaptor subunit n=1 Tax=Ectobacillus ponti TaxID=2961894 RepID=A0AA42BTA7_9BACI|nr:HlyD family efflux transporter periplasmic adaptor subunit [Ectobacillus ponti]MCP8969268.1 HlyD family efflux transporter periplasmic adaptor subunit [Ectobacillus ponti]